MLGRAGRPGLDDHGIALIMTSDDEKSAYVNIHEYSEVIESMLLPQLVEG